VVNPINPGARIPTRLHPSISNILLCQVALRFEARALAGCLIDAAPVTEAVLVDEPAA